MFRAAVFRLGGHLVGPQFKPIFPPGRNPPILLKRLEKLPKTPPQLIPAEAMQVHTIRDVRSKKKIKRRGPKSGGRTHGRGFKGLNKRNPHKMDEDYEGGQAKLVERLPRLPEGIRNQEYKPPFGIEGKPFAQISLGAIQCWIDSARLSPQVKITPKVLLDCGLVRGTRWPGYVVTEHGAEFFASKLDIALNMATPRATEIIRSFGGNVSSVYMSPKDWAAHLQPHIHPPPEQPELPSPDVWQTYRNVDVGGYLSGKDHLFAAHAHQWAQEKQEAQDALPKIRPIQAIKLQREKKKQERLAEMSPSVGARPPPKKYGKGKRGLRLYRAPRVLFKRA
eukprot:TRINITY_DN83486_c0_g1_i1.p1 TRINITY_DN83486_c0_g1~~TRINITY_DN83486_c0_g1_i1.p1  ORF type:complete len:346 (+),score=28.65 TRINITY_DN83486_c0_g1_i1:33-1040(+)